MNESRVARAEAAFAAGYNCCQAVLLAHAEEHGLAPDLAARLGTCFVAGLGYSGEVCGAVIGGLLAIGLHAGRDEAGDQAGEKRAARLAREFLAGFQERNQVIACRDLRQLHKRDMVRGLARGRFRTDHCAGCVRDAAELVELVLDQAD